MRTRKDNNHKLVFCTIQNSITIVLFTLFLLSCSKDDGPETTIMANSQTFSLNGINNCNTSLGSGSSFVMDIPYTILDGAVISKLRIKTTVSDGGSEEKLNTQFSDKNSTITWATCFRFGGQDWVEFDVQLESNKGGISNVSKVRINKPDGAN